MAIVRYLLRIVALAALLIGAGLASPAALGQQRVGVNAAVNPAATGIPPNAAARQRAMQRRVLFAPLSRAQYENVSGTPAGSLIPESATATGSCSSPSAC